jgi:hypothetical protein
MQVRLCKSGRRSKAPWGGPGTGLRGGRLTVGAGILLLCLLPSPGRCDLVTLFQSGGVAITTVQSNQRYSAAFGNANGLAAGTPAAGVTAMTSGVTGGALYGSPLAANVRQIQSSNRANVYVRVSTGFAFSNLTAMACPSGAACGSGGGAYGAIPATTPGYQVASSVPNNGSATFWLGIRVADTNGASASRGASSVVLVFRSVDTTDGSYDECQLTVSTTVQSAVRLRLTSGGGLAFNSGSATDFAVNFGGVNGLGLSPASGLSTAAVAGGHLYSTPYVIQPQYSSQTVTTSTVRFYVNSNFVHPAVLQLRDSATSAPAGFSALPTTAAGAISLAASNGTPITRYLGLFVSGDNGAAAYSGADSANIVYTLTVQ